MANKKRGHKKKQRNWISHGNAMKRHKVLESMHPGFRWRVEAVIEHLYGKGWQAFVWQGKTRSEAQAAKNAKKGTGIKMSWHRPDVHGGMGAQLVALYAADIVDERWGWKGPTMDKNHAFWNDLGGFAKAQGLEWGGDWAKRDVGHVQMKLIDMAMPDSVVV